MAARGDGHVRPIKAVASDLQFMQTALRGSHVGSASTTATSAQVATSAYRQNSSQHTPKRWMTPRRALEIPEIVGLVCQHVYLEALQLPLDPPLVTGRVKSNGTAALLALSRVNRLFHAEAAPLLYADVSLGVPACFEGFLGTVGVLVPTTVEDEEDASDVSDRPGRKPNHTYEEREGLLTPPASRETSRDRDYPNTASLTAALGSASLDDTSPSRMQFATEWRLDNPGLHVESLTFEKFRSHGLKRTVRESSRQRFVTSDRILQILRGTRGPGKLLGKYNIADHVLAIGKLSAIGLTEYIDSSINLEVLEEILFRGGTAVRSDVKTLRGSDFAKKTQPVTRLDLCGCVSRVFTDALEQLRYKHIMWTDPELEDEATVFPHVQRLGLFNVILDNSLFKDFVMAFPHLTHLDLGNTRTSPALLAMLAASKTIRLQSLSLAKCSLLTSESLRDFLCHSQANVLADLTELNLYYEGSLSVPLTRDHLKEVLETSQPLTSGKLVFLDIATAPLDDELLANALAAQPALIDLGLANCPALTWRAFSTFLENKANKVEVLDLRGSCRQPLVFGNANLARVARRNDALLNSIMGIHQFLVTPVGQRQRVNLRVIELEEKVLDSLDEAKSHPDWRVCYGKGWRGWYVNCGVEGKALPDGSRALVPLNKNDTKRTHIVELAKKSKNGSYNFGWHSRKMAILGEHGMLGREHGLYSFHAFS